MKHWQEEASLQTRDAEYAAGQKKKCESVGQLFPTCILQRIMVLCRAFGMTIICILFIRLEHHHVHFQLF